MFCSYDYEPAPLDGLLHSAPAAFLICGGPSFNKINFAQLNQRGIWTMAVNNAAAHPLHKPNAFVCADPPMKFHDAIWRDPGIMKFVPEVKLRRGRSVLRQKVEKRFEKLPISVRDCPNVWGFKRRSWFQPDETFFREEAAWGNHNRGCERTGEPKTVCTMLLGIRLLYELGARRIYLLGVDFDMEGGYSFPQGRDADAVASNNEQYRVVNRWLTKMTETDVWLNADLEIFNCNGDSKLEAFEHQPFHQAIDVALSDFPRVIDTKGWYEKTDEDGGD